MPRLIFDIETNGLLDQMDRIHCLAIKDVDTGEVWSFADQPGHTHISHGLSMLEEADAIIGHNILKFDIPAIQIVHPEFNPQGTKLDTLTISRVIWADLKERDFVVRNKPESQRKYELPGNQIGSHALGAWGTRMGFPKDSYSADMKAQGLDPWASWNQTMHDYCVQDVEVTAKLWSLIVKAKWPRQSIQLEHDFQEIILLQEQHGFHFDVAKAQALYTHLSIRREEIENELQVTFPPEKRDMKAHVWVAGGVTFDTKKEALANGFKAKDITPGPLKFKMIPFNPGSRDHIAKRLIEAHGWKPTEFTQEGKPKVDETILSKMPYPEAKLLNEYLMISKRIGQLAEGNQAWLKLERNGRIHGGVITNGAVTGRCTHQRPNVAQTPAVGVPYGKEFRELFYAPSGYKLVGCDASGLELRCLAHFMARYDGGAYTKELLEGDIHTANQKAAGLPTRNNAKTFIYAFLYGAGDQKIGSIVEPNASAQQQRKVGKSLKSKFLKATPAIKRLREQVVGEATKNGHLIGLDGRKLYIRSEHAALNTLLQSAGGLVVKQATVLLYQDLCRAGYVFGEDYANVAHIHDEFQLITREDLADGIGRRAVAAIRAAGSHFKFSCPLDGEFKIGNNWADTH